MNIISISDLSVTEQNLKRIAGECETKIEAAKAMACTEDTKTAVKKTRAELKKQFAAYEEERKARTAEYEKPLKAFKALYDTYITKPFTEADSALKQKIDEVENRQKAEKYDHVKVYAEELKTAYALEWLDVDRIMPNVTLSKSEAALKAEAASVLDKIKTEADCIHQIHDGDEVLAEYMKCLNMAQARLTVDERRHALEAAQKAKQAYTKQEEVKQEAATKVEQLAPPVVEEPEKTFQMTFTVSGTLSQLKALKAFLIENNIDFKNGGNSQ